MLRSQVCRLSQSPSPAFHRLAGDGRDQIHIDICKAFFPGHLVCFQEILPGMDAAQHSQLPIIHGLGSDAQPVDAKLAVSLQLLSCHCPRIHLCGDLRIFRQPKGLPYRLENSSGLVRFQNGRRPSSQEDADNRRNLCQRSMGADLPAKVFHISLPLCLGGRSGQEITIVTFTDTKWNMKV